jgi:hypothetical protein
LFFCHVGGIRIKAKEAASLIVEKGGKDTRGIEVRQAQPVNGAVFSYQSSGMHVSDKSVIFDGEISHLYFTLLLNMQVSVTEKRFP